MAAAVILIEQEGLFAPLWKRQTDGFLPDEIN